MPQNDNWRYSRGPCYLHGEVVHEALPAGRPLQEIVDVALEGVPHALLVVVDLPEVHTAALMVLLQDLRVCKNIFMLNQICADCIPLQGTCATNGIVQHTDCPVPLRNVL